MSRQTHDLEVQIRGASIWQCPFGWLCPLVLDRVPKHGCRMPPWDYIGASLGGPHTAAPLSTMISKDFSTSSWRSLMVPDVVIPSCSNSHGVMDSHDRLVVGSDSNRSCCSHYCPLLITLAAASSHGPDPFHAPFLASCRREEVCLLGSHFKRFFGIFVRMSMCHSGRASIDTGRCFFGLLFCFNLDFSPPFCHCGFGLLAFVSGQRNFVCFALHVSLRFRPASLPPNAVWIICFVCASLLSAARNC